MVGARLSGYHTSSSRAGDTRRRYNAKDLYPTPRNNGRDTMDAEQPPPSSEESREEAALLKLQEEFRHFVHECHECRRCGKPERGYDARHSYATQRFEPTRSSSKLGRFCQPCAVEVAHEKNLEHTASRQARHGEVRHLVKEGKEVGEQYGSGETERAGDKSPH
jgi:hypothetical protein